MKKEWLRKLVILLFAVMLYSVCTMSATVLAASKITLQNGSETPNIIYVGQTIHLKVSGSSVKFYSRDKSIATIGLTNGKLKAIAVGEVEIIARSTENGRIVAKAIFEVNERATSLKTDVKELYLEKNQTTTIKGILSPKTSTDVLRFISSDEDVATVDLESGKVTAKENGTAVITVYALSPEEIDIETTDKKTTKVMVYVKDYIKEVNQIETNKLEVKFNHDISGEKIDASKFQVTGKNADDIFNIQKVEVKPDANEVILTMYSQFIDGGTYSVTYNKKPVQFKASDGKITKIEVSPTVISCGAEIPIYIDFYDSKGILLEHNPMKDNDNVEINIVVQGGYVIDSAICFANESSYATVNATYHTNKYSQGTETGMISSGDVRVNAISSEETVKQGFTYTITDKKERPSFELADYKQNKIITVDDTSNYIYFFIADSAGREYDQYDNYEVTSSDINVLKLIGNSNELDHKMEVMPMREGTVNLEIRNKHTKQIILTMPITVLAERKATTIKLDKNRFRAATSKAPKESESFTIHVLDQYGQEMAQKNGLFTSQIKVSDVSDVKDGCPMKQCILTRNNVITIYTADSPEATYRYKIQYQDLAPVYFEVTYKNK